VSSAEERPIESALRKWAYAGGGVIPTKGKAAILNEPGLEVSEVRIEWFKDFVQLSDQG